VNKWGVENITEMSHIEALEKLALITKKGLDTLVQIPDTENEPITINKAINAIRHHFMHNCETYNYVISGEGIRKVGDYGCLGDFEYRVVEE
jgi:hypothetical protein